MEALDDEGFRSAAEGSRGDYLRVFVKHFSKELIFPMGYDAVSGGGIRPPVGEVDAEGESFSETFC